MDNEQLEHKFGEICGNCESLFKYGWSEKCDHLDWHVISITLSAEPCNNCHDIFHKWEESDDLQVDWDHIKELIDLAMTQGLADPGQEL